MEHGNQPASITAYFESLEKLIKHYWILGKAKANNKAWGKIKTKNNEDIDSLWWTMLDLWSLKKI